MQKSKLKLILPWIPVALCMAMIFYFSSQNADESSKFSVAVGILMKLNIPNWILRKIAHFSEFALLAFLTENALFACRKAIMPVSTVIFAAVYACTDEFHQIFVDGRGCRAFDVLIDSAGALVGAVAAAIILLLIVNLKKAKK